MEKVKFQFTCEASEYKELKDKAVWTDCRKQIVIEKNRRSKRKEGWIEKLVMEIHEATISDYTDFYETEKSIIIDFYHFVYIGIQGEFQEDCYKFLSNMGDRVEKVMRKFRIKDYSLIHIFQPFGVEKEIILDEEDIVHSEDSNPVVWGIR